MRHYFLEIRQDNGEIRVNYSMFKREVGFIRKTDPKYYNWKVIHTNDMTGEDSKLECGAFLRTFRKHVFDFFDFNSPNGRRNS